MHETSLAENLLELIAEAARERSFERVLAVRVAVGELAGVEPEALRFCFGALCRDSPAEGATLRIDRVAGRAWCMDCSREVALPDRLAGCALCGGFGLRIKGGDELRLLDLEVR